jgi:hypothetical protein
METVERNIIKKICKLKMFFTPFFFYSTKHLPIHLAYEAKVGGSVQYKWMYPFERLEITSIYLFVNIPFSYSSIITCM